MMIFPSKIHSIGIAVVLLANSLLWGQDSKSGAERTTESAARPVKQSTQPVSVAPQSAVTPVPSSRPEDNKLPAFLPAVEVSGGNQPTVERGGTTIPLRPEMLPETSASLTIPEVTKSTMSNGIRLYVYESHDLPSIHFTVIVNAGKNIEPESKVGLAEITAKSLRAGGTEIFSSDEFDRELEQLGSNLEVSVERDYIRLEMYALTENRDKALSLLVSMLTAPAFDEKRLLQQKDLKVGEIRRENDEPSDISRREFRKIIYGRNHPLARTPTAEDINGITRDDVRKFYDDYYRPASVQIGIAGDITPADARKLVDSQLAGWTSPPANLPAPVVLDESSDMTSGVYIIRKQTAQSQIRIGHLGIPRQAPEQYAANVMNNIYGSGGFSSRLMQQVRTKMGYVYGVGGALQSDIPVGLFAAAAGSKAKTTAAAIEEIINVTRDFLTGNVTDEELEIARRDVVYSFITNFDVPREIVFNYMHYDFLGYPEDYLPTFIPKIQSVTKTDVVQTARKFMHPDRLKIFVVGDEASFDKPLSTFGEVNEIRLTGPGE